MVKATGTFLIEYVFDSESLEGIEAQNQGVTLVQKWRKKYRKIIDRTSGHADF